MSKNTKLDILIDLYPDVNPDYIKFMIDNKVRKGNIEKIFNFIIKNGHSIDEYTKEHLVELDVGIKNYVENLKAKGIHQSVINVDRYILFFGEEEGKRIWDNHRKSKSKKCKKWQLDNPESAKKSIITKKLNGTIGKEYSIRCKEYWMRIGYSEEEAIEQVAIKQKRDLNHFIKLYGEEKSLIKWNERQTKWQKTLNSKTQEEIDSINKKKAVYSYNECIRRGMNKEEAIEYLSYIPSGLKNIYFSEEELKNAIQSWVDLHDFRSYKNHANILKYFSGTNCFAGWDKPKDYLKWLEENIILSKTEKCFLKKGKFPSYMKYTDNGNVLRSSKEIMFYNLLIKEGYVEDIDFLIDNKYPGDTLKRYDFYIVKLDLYIEIAGYTDDIDYMENILDKTKNVNSIVLSNNNEFEPFIKSLAQ